MYMYSIMMYEIFNLKSSEVESESYFYFEFELFSICVNFTSFIRVCMPIGHSIILQ